MGSELPRRILVTNCQLDHLTGTEIVVRDLALGLRAVGHEPMVFSPKLGTIARELTAAGIETVSDLKALSATPHLIHGHHHWETVRAFARFPWVPGLFVCHDGSALTDIPPPLPNILRYVAVDLNCRQRLSSVYGIPEDHVEVILNAVDLDRFQCRPPLPQRPQRALIFSNYARPGSHLEPIQEACRQAGLMLDVIGEGVGAAISNPEAQLSQYDLVFAKGRCALEAMAVGTAVILCGTEGLGPMVTSENVARLRQWNFGMRLLTNPLDLQLITKEIQMYNARDAAVVSAFIRREAGLSQSLEHYQGLYETILDEWAHGGTTTTADLWNPYVHTMLRWLSRQEIELKSFREGIATQPIEEEAARRCQIHIEECPQSVIRDKVFAVAVKFRNCTSGSLSSQPPYPICFSHRWLDTSGQMIHAEGLRTPLQTPLASGEERTVFIRVQPPDVPGVYGLRVTIVQEWVRWWDWDAVHPPVADEAKVVVVEDSAPR